MPVSEHNVPQTTPRDIPCRTCTDFKSWAKEQRTMMSDAPVINNTGNINTVSQQVITVEIVKYINLTDCNVRSISQYLLF